MGGQVALIEAAEPLCDTAEAGRLGALLADRRAALPALQRRAEIYQREGILGRLCGVAKLTASGGYAGGSPAASGLLDLATDLAAAIPLGLFYRKGRFAGLLHA